MSAIGRHLVEDRKTIRAYLAGERVAGVWARAKDPHLCHLVDAISSRWDRLP
jgi:hypothetical protein